MQGSFPQTATAPLPNPDSSHESLSPQHGMKTILLALGFFLFSQSLFASSTDLGQPVPFTPYEIYMENVKNVLQSIKGKGASMDRAEELMREGRALRYSFNTPFAPALPSTTAAIRAGDCKAKSLWLCERLSDQNVRFVIGKTNANSSINHAWVLWQHEGKWWILDCTRNDRPVSTDKLSKSEYVPLYSYGSRGSFRHRQS